MLLLVLELLEFWTLLLFCEFCPHDGTTVITDCFFDFDDLDKLGKSSPSRIGGADGTEGGGATLLDLGVVAVVDFEQVHCKTSFH